MTKETPKLVEGVTNTKLLIQAGKVDLTHMNVENVNAGKVYLQFFDAAATADVTLGTTVPVMSIPIPATTIWDGPISLYFKKGIVVAATNGRKDAAAPSGVLACNFIYTL